MEELCIPKYRSFFFRFKRFFGGKMTSQDRGLITACLMIPLQLKTKQNISEEYSYKVPLLLSQPSFYHIFPGSAP